MTEDELISQMGLEVVGGPQTPNPEDAVISEMGLEVVNQPSQFGPRLGPQAPLNPESMLMGKGPLPEVDTTGVQMPPKKNLLEMSMMERIYDMFTGESKRTPQSMAAKDWKQMSAFKDTFSMPSFMSQVGTALAGGEEDVQIIASQAGLDYTNPDHVRQDAEGNYFFKDLETGEWHSRKPGFGWDDAAGLSTMLGGSIYSLFGKGAAKEGIKRGVIKQLATAGAKEAGIQTGIEAIQLGAGAELDFSDLEDIAMATGAGVGGEALQKIGSGIASLFKNKVVAEGTKEAVEGITDETAKEFAKTVKQAAGGSEKATRKLIAEYDPNLTKMQVFKDLGIDVPPDLYSDSELVKDVAGLSRSLVKSPQAGAWKTTVKDASKRMDDLLEELGGKYSYVEEVDELGKKVMRRGKPAISDLSDDLGMKIEKLKDDFESTGRKLYNEVDQAVSRTSEPITDNLEKYIADRIAMVGEEGLKPKEKEVIKLIQGVKDGTVPFGRLLEEKSEMGAVLRKEMDKSPWNDLRKERLTQLHDAMKADRALTVEIGGGPEALEKLRTADYSWARKGKLEKQMVKYFSKELDGSLSSVFSKMISEAGKVKAADVTKLRRTLKSIPEELAYLKKDIVLTGLADAAISANENSLVKGKFGFNEFYNMWDSIRSSGSAMNAISDAIGPEAVDTLNKIGKASEWMTDARNRVINTGKANQALVGALKADNLMGAVLKKGAKIGSFGLAGGPVAGQAADSMAGAAVEFVNKSDRDTMMAVGELFNDPKFQQTIESAITGAIDNEKTALRLAYNRKVRNFMDAVGEPSDPANVKKWVLGALRAERTMEPQGE